MAPFSGLVAVAQPIGDAVVSATAMVDSGIAEAERQPVEVYAFASNAKNLPAWASGISKGAKVRFAGKAQATTKAGGAPVIGFKFRLDLQNPQPVKGVIHHVQGGGRDDGVAPQDGQGGAVDKRMAAGNLIAE